MKIRLILDDSYDTSEIIYVNEYVDTLYSIKSNYVQSHPSLCMSTLRFHPSLYLHSLLTTPLHDIFIPQIDNTEVTLELYSFKRPSMKHSVYKPILINSNVITTTCIDALFHPVHNYIIINRAGTVVVYEIIELERETYKLEFIRCFDHFKRYAERKDSIAVTYDGSFMICLDTSSETCVDIWDVSSSNVDKWNMINQCMLHNAVKIIPAISKVAIIDIDCNCHVLSLTNYSSPPQVIYTQTYDTVDMDCECNSAHFIHNFENHVQTLVTSTIHEGQGNDVIDVLHVYTHNVKTFSFGETINKTKQKMIHDVMNALATNNPKGVVLRSCYTIDVDSSGRWILWNVSKYDSEYHRRTFELLRISTL